MHSRLTEYNVENTRKDFPLFQHEPSCVYFDNAATTQKPQEVIDALLHFYTLQNANIHRGVYDLAHTATTAYENARTIVQEFIQAAKAEEIVFVKSATEAINLVASTFGRSRIGEGDNVVISHMEHHANWVPWQMLCQEKGAELRIIPVDERGELCLDALDDLLDDRTQLVSIIHISNTLGTINPIDQVINRAHQLAIPVLLDAAQSALSHKLDMQSLDCDFCLFSGHKVLGPTGIGVLYGKEKWLEVMPPYQMGGDMIRSVTVEETTFGQLPHKFEAGTPPIADAIGLGAAITYIRRIGRPVIKEYINYLLEYATSRLNEVPGLRIVGTANEKTGIISFLLDEVHPHDIGTILNEAGIAIRAGHHCTMPLMHQYNIPGTARVSFSLYNTPAEIDQLVAALYNVKHIFS